jgi:maltose alpha-D-glucosyltransferase/alpha-amylase
MHAALATPTNDEAFRPEPLTRPDLEKLSESLSEHAGQAFDLLKAKLPDLPDEFVDRAALVLGQRRRLLARLRALAQMDPDTVQVRIHGDYHLGQVLWVENDFVILDFEGEPARPLEERRRKKPPLQDVAGMLRSFSYAAYASLLNYTARGPEEFERLERWAVLWERWTSAAFLKGYRQSAAPHAFIPQRNEAFQILLDALLLDKALYELGYELNNRPGWARIPLRGILDLAH